MKLPTLAAIVAIAMLSQSCVATYHDYPKDIHLAAYGPAARVEVTPERAVAETEQISAATVGGILGAILKNVLP